MTIEKRKLKVAGWFNQKINNLSIAQKRIGLFGFCILFGALSFYMLEAAVCNRPAKMHVLIVDHLRSGMPPDSFRNYQLRMFQNLNQIQKMK